MQGFIKALKNRSAKAWLERNNPDAPFIMQRYPPKGHPQRSPKGQRQPAQKRGNLLLQAARHGQLGDVLDHFNERGVHLGLKEFEQSASSGLLEMLVANDSKEAMRLIDQIRQNGEQITKSTLLKPKKTRTHTAIDTKIGRLPPDVIIEALATSGQNLSKRDLMSQLPTGQTLATALIQKGHPAKVIDIMEGCNSGFTKQDLLFKRRTKKQLCILEAIFTSDQPDLLLKLPMAKGQQLDGEIWDQIGRMEWWLHFRKEGKFRSRLRQLASSEQWFKRDMSELKEFFEHLHQPDREAIGEQEILSLHPAQRTLRHTRGRDRKKARQMTPGGSAP